MVQGGPAKSIVNSGHMAQRGSGRKPGTPREGDREGGGYSMISFNDTVVDEGMKMTGWVTIFQFDYQQSERGSAGDGDSIFFNLVFST